MAAGRQSQRITLAQIAVRKNLLLAYRKVSCGKRSDAPDHSRGSGAGADRDCGHFDTHAEAQAFFIAAGGPARDPHRLDGDGDGIACESLP
jgi:hypothetical protein